MARSEIGQCDSLHYRRKYNEFFTDSLSLSGPERRNIAFRSDISMRPAGLLHCNRSTVLHDQCDAIDEGG